MREFDREIQNISQLKKLNLTQYNLWNHPTEQTLIGITMYLMWYLSPQLPNLHKNRVGAPIRPANYVYL